jgi:hypothetical protein
MSQDIQYFCPKCQGMELRIKQPEIYDVTKKNGGATAHCPLCNWTGLAEEVVAALRPENAEFWTSDRVANVMLYALTKHAVGPVLQALELVGMLPRIQGSDEEQASARQIREHVIKEVLANTAATAFAAAATHAPQHYARFDPEQGKAVERVFSYGEQDVIERC